MPGRQRIVVFSSELKEPQIKPLIEEVLDRLEDGWKFSMEICAVIGRVQNGRLGTFRNRTNAQRAVPTFFSTESEKRINTKSASFIDVLLFVYLTRVSRLIKTR